MSPVIELNINLKTCGKWKSRYILDILEKYPQTNFHEWELLEIHHQNDPNKIAVNMVCKFWYVAGKLVRLHGPIKSYFVKKPYTIK